LAQFYGWTHDYITGLPHRIARAYYDAITVIEAQDALVKMNISDYPKMKGEARKKYFRSMRKTAYPPGLQKETSFEEFIGKMQDGR
jgi:hypothetical protein